MAGPESTRPQANNLGAGQTERDPTRMEDFASAHDQAAERIQSVTLQLHNFCDRINGAEPTSVHPGEVADREIPNCAFRSIEITHANLFEQVCALETVLGRIEQLNLA